MNSLRACDPYGPTAPTVMPGLVPGIALSQLRQRVGKRVDGRDKPGHDGTGVPQTRTNFDNGTLDSGIYSWLWMWSRPTRMQTGTGRSLSGSGGEVYLCSSSSSTTAVM